MDLVIDTAPDAPVYTKTLTHSGMWSGVISRGKTLRLTDLAGGANVGLLLYNADVPSERYNFPDTLKGQHIFYLRHPYCLHSDMGRVLASITADTVAWQVENSDVLPPASVAVEVITLPTVVASRPVTVKLVNPLPSVLAVPLPR